MIVVSISLGLTLYSQAGLAGWASLTGAIMLYLGLAGLNGEWRNAQIIAELNDEIARLEAIILQRGRAASEPAASPELAVRPAAAPIAATAPPLTEARPHAAMPPLRGPQNTGVPGSAAQATPAGGQPLQQPRSTPDFASAFPAFPAHPPRAHEPASGSPVGTEADAAGWFEQSSSPFPETTVQASPSALGAERPAVRPSTAGWDFRPAEPRFESDGLAAAPLHDGSFGGHAAMPPPLPVASSIREADVAIIQGLIEKLAHEVNSADATGGRRSPSSAPQSAVTDSTIESSLKALRATSDAMRREPGDREIRLPGSPLDSVAPAPRWASPVTANGNHARLAALAEAITSRRVDLLLEPILGLEDHRPRYYTVHIRPRLASGAPIHSDNLLDELRDTGLLPVLDCTRIARIAEVARRLADRGKAGAVFSEFSSESLGNDQFLADFAKAYHERDGLSDQLVLSFAQSDVRAFAPADWTTIADMRDLGFRFALQHVTDLDMDFERVRAHGFDFITLDADVFLNGLPAPGGVVPVADLCRYLAGLGLTLIVEHIDDEAKLARIFGFGALYGQGQLFGGPRLLKAEVARAATAIAGAAHAAA